MMPNVLIVDDEPDLLEAFRLALQLNGYDVEAVSSAEEAEQVLGVALPSVMVLDISLPGMTGWELIDRMRADQLWSAVPVVIVSAHVDDRSAERARALGYPYLNKPCPLDQLLRTVAAAIN